MAAHYNNDFYGWTQEQANFLRAGNLNQLDTQNLLEEIEGVGNSQRNELESQFEWLFIHLLKWLFQPSHRGRSWRLTIVRRLEKSPSLQNELNELMTDAYGDAILSAARETGLNEEILPKQCPWSFEQTINNEFFQNDGFTSHRALSIAV
ncbi:hypothetical protein Rin_00005370 [Candidatus Regiella insecticola 5.15]|uniref:DUF29 domain-containing protein n=1 Tax=Candidatus Regiella insecticola 5.15 TaxID=1005043 RepID=G2GXP4_9ENTR|nr:DUF29 domain-containing protein [Candidatus Regiella insecticola]EGY29486.1 hypothetical protein Rin_00005370 [Candidatus Regiella insecticola 5.15]